jgi:prevent-host-death family protein
MKYTWQLQEAKVKFSKVIAEADEYGPQYITKHGKESAVVISIKDFKELTKKKNTLSAFFQESPLYEIEFERQKDIDREIDL